MTQQVQITGVMDRSMANSRQVPELPSDVVLTITRDVEEEDGRYLNVMSLEEGFLALLDRRNLDLTITGGGVFITIQYDGVDFRVVTLDVDIRLGETLNVRYGTLHSGPVGVYVSEPPDESPLSIDRPEYRDFRWDVLAEPWIIVVGHPPLP